MTFDALFQLTSVASRELSALQSARERVSSEHELVAMDPAYDQAWHTYQSSFDALLNRLHPAFLRAMKEYNEIERNVEFITHLSHLSLDIRNQHISVIARFRYYPGGNEPSGRLSSEELSVISFEFGELFERELKVDGITNFTFDGVVVPAKYYK